MEGDRREGRRRGGGGEEEGREGRGRGEGRGGEEGRREEGRGRGEERGGRGHMLTWLLVCTVRVLFRQVHTPVSWSHPSPWPLQLHL